MRVLNTCARAQKARFLLTADGGGDGGVYASAAGASEGAGHEVANDNPAAAVPLVFPYSAHAGDHGGLCAHAEP